MRGRLNGLTMNRDGSQNVTVTICSDFREEYDRLAGAEVEVSIKKASNHRSLDANAYAWVLIDKLAAVLHTDKVDVYRQAILDIGGVSTTVCVQDKALEALRAGWESKGIGWQTETMPSKLDGCTNVILYYGSSSYDTRQMSSLIDHLIQDAEAQGIETITPQRRSELLNQWEASCRRRSTATSPGEQTT